MASISLPPYLSKPVSEWNDADVRDLEIFLTQLSDLVNTQQLVDSDSVVSKAQLQSIVANSADFAAFKVAITAL